MDDKKVSCPLCGETMTQKKVHGNEFWECPCGVEVWPPDEHVEKAIRKTMYSSHSAKKGSGTRRKARYKSKKPGEKFIPWYQKY